MEKELRLFLRVFRGQIRTSSQKEQDDRPQLQVNELEDTAFAGFGGHLSLGSDVS